MRRDLLLIGSTVVLVMIIATVYVVMTPEDVRRDMGMSSGLEEGNLPAVKGYAEGIEVSFVHPEASDPVVAGMLTEMMGGSPVLVVPSLSNVPDSALATVYVFTNGIEGDGPLGFQVDVFDDPPGTTGYSPLRALVRATWTDQSVARVLTSEADVMSAVSDGDLTLDRSGVVVNMPFLSWADGQR